MCKPWEISNRMQCVSCLNYFYNILSTNLIYYLLSYQDSIVD